MKMTTLPVPANSPYNVAYFRLTDPDKVLKVWQEGTGHANQIRCEVFGDKRTDKLFEFTYVNRLPDAILEQCQTLGVSIYGPIQFFPAYQGHVPEGLVVFEGCQRSAGTS